MMVKERKVKIINIKKFAAREFPPNSALRDVILGERDSLTVQEFLAKLDVWLRLGEVMGRDTKTGQGM